MQQIKSIKTFSETDNSFSNNDTLSNTFIGLLAEFKLVKINKLLNLSKTKGAKQSKLFEALFLLPFVSILSVRALCISGLGSELSSKKDCFYSLLNNPKINWRKIVTSFAMQFVSISKSKSVDADVKNESPPCLIVDDSLLEKTGKKIETIGKVFDHCTHTFVLGIKTLVLGFWDGKSFLPIDFSLHNEAGKLGKRGLKGKELKAQYSKPRNLDSYGAQRLAEVATSKIDTAIELIKRAVKNKFVPKYVLADSWFITDGFITEIIAIKQKIYDRINVIGIMKMNRKFIVNNKEIKAELIPEFNRKNIKKCRLLKCSYISIFASYKGTNMRLFFVKMNGQNNWKMLITTDTKLSFVTAMKYYQIRWAIEVFFKDCKQNLHLGKCQSNDFDAHIASISICFMNYMLLSLAKRFECYETLGIAFKNIKEAILEDNIVQKIWRFLTEVFMQILAELGVDADSFIRKLILVPNFLNTFANSFKMLLTSNYEGVKSVIYNSET